MASTCHSVGSHLSRPLYSSQWCYTLWFQSYKCLISHPCLLSHCFPRENSSQNTKSICCSVYTVSDQFFPESVRLSHRDRTTNPNFHFSLGEVSLWLLASLSVSGPRSEPLCSLLPNSFSCASVVTEVRFSQSDDCWAPAAIHSTPALGIYCL